MLDHVEGSLRIVHVVGAVLEVELLVEKGGFLRGAPGDYGEFVGAAFRVDLEKKVAVGRCGGT
jgi:hypothetical protein